MTMSVASDLGLTYISFELQFILFYFFVLQIFCSHELMEEMIEEMDFVQDAEKVLFN